MRLFARGIRPGGVTGVRMPSRYTSGLSNDLADELARRLGVRLETVAIEAPFTGYMTALEALFDHSEKPEFVYRHVWKVGDLLVWDNRCSMHARDDFPADQRRLMLRTTVQGTVRPS